MESKGSEFVEREEASILLWRFIKTDLGRELVGGIIIRVLEAYS